MEIRGKYKITLSSLSDGSQVAVFRLNPAATLPDGSETDCVNVRGYNIPETKDVEYVLSGEFEPYFNKRLGKDSFSFRLEELTVILPSEEEAAIKYLQTLKGIGKVLAKNLFKTFKEDVFSIIEHDYIRLCEVKNVSKKKAEKIHEDFMRRQINHKVFTYLYKFGLKERQISKIITRFKEDTMDVIEADPYQILEVPGVGWTSAEKIAYKNKFPKDSYSRIYYGVLEVLRQGESSGELFQKYNTYPSWEINQLSDKLRDELKSNQINTVGSTYLSRNILYLKLLLLLGIHIEEKRFDATLLDLHRKKRIFLSIDRENLFPEGEKIKVYRYSTAIAEFQSAKTMVEMVKRKLPPLRELDNTIFEVEKKLKILLSSEQNEAVKKAMTNSLSVITGGPGTGKTSIQKVIINTFKAYFPSEEILLMAPTGRAAKRMSESSGENAITIHKALNLYQDEDGNTVETDSENTFREKLIIVDESSMLGSLLLEKILKHIPKGARVVFVGDVEQLPSIEVGAVLREMINSKVIPVTMLTKTYRQAVGSTIVINATRIKNGEHRLSYDDDFRFEPDTTSDEIRNTVVSQVKPLIEKYSREEVMVLTAYRRNTESGANQLNLYLREALRNDITESTKYFEKNGMKIYEGDLVMNTKNTESLTNGDIGYVKSIVRMDGTLLVNLTFDGIEVCLEDEETDALELAYATTVHKAQGSEAKAVILVCDAAHKLMLKRNLFYTGITRAKEKLIIVGQPEALQFAIKTQDSVYRRSQLGYLLQKFKREQKKTVAPVKREKAEQLSFA